MIFSSASKMVSSNWTAALACIKRVTESKNAMRRCHNIKSARRMDTNDHNSQD